MGKRSSAWSTGKAASAVKRPLNGTIVDAGVVVRYQVPLGLSRRDRRAAERAQAKRSLLSGTGIQLVMTSEELASEVE